MVTVENTTDTAKMDLHENRCTGGEVSKVDINEASVIGRLLFTSAIYLGLAAENECKTQKTDENRGGL